MTGIASGIGAGVVGRCPVPDPGSGASGPDDSTVVVVLDCSPSPAVAIAVEVGVSLVATSSVSSEDASVADRRPVSASVCSPDATVVVTMGDPESDIVGDAGRSDSPSVDGTATGEALPSSFAPTAFGSRAGTIGASGATVTSNSANAARVVANSRSVRRSWIRKTVATEIAITAIPATNPVSPPSQAATRNTTATAGPAIGRASRLIRLGSGLIGTARLHEARNASYVRGILRVSGVYPTGDS